MAEFSTTQPAGAPVQSCPTDCKAALRMAQEDVNRIARLDGPIARNRAITAAYTKLAADMPQNDWVRLASYVSVQGGCAMQRTQAWDTQSVGRVIVNPEQALEALGDANLTIFSSIYPPNRMAANCGYEKFKQCVESGEIKVDPAIADAMNKMERGDRRGAADAIALHEQRDVVQPVYDRWRDTFGDLQNAENLKPGDQTSIPVASRCTRDNLVPLNGEVSVWEDRVEYYHSLMNEMYRIEER